MINLVDEISDLLTEYNLNLNDVIFVVNCGVVENEDFLEKNDVFYDNGWGLCNFANIQIVIDDYAWFERTSYDGCEKFILKAHPLLSKYQNRNLMESIFMKDDMVTDAWFSKAERHIDVCELYFDMGEYPFIVNSCFLAMYSVVKALFVLKNIECKTLEGLIYLLKINYLDQGLFDRDLFKFFCNTKELNSEFLQILWDGFDEKIALKIFNNTRVFIDYSKDLFDELSNG